ncbi:MAG: trypsin-like serine protease [Deltaproteobacteria bacterium]
MSESPSIAEEEARCETCGKPHHFDSEQSLTRLVSELRATVRELSERLDAVEGRPKGHGARGIPLTRAERVLGGRLSLVGDWPATVCVGRARENSETRWVGSGVVIHPFVVLTAAHVAGQLESASLRVLTRSVEAPPRSADAVVLDVAEVAIHPEYRSGGAPSNDLALLRLADHSPVDPVAFADPGLQLHEGRTLVLCGFGAADEHGLAGFGTLRWAEERPLSADPNDEAEYGFDNSFEFVVGRRKGSLDTCRGDSGGPVYFINDQVVELVGVTLRPVRDRTRECGDGGVYARVGAYRTWIDGVVAGWKYRL